jgi:flagellar P-ring protein precursor FlgI
MTRALSLLLLLCLAAPAARAGEKVKDLAEVVGVRENQLVGLGLVVGLDGTGDSSAVLAQTLASTLRKLGVNISADQVKAKNVAVVALTAVLPPFVRPGSTIDVTASSAGDSKSLAGGTLLRSPLSGADGNVYAVAQGSLVVAGLQAGGAGASVQRNHPTVGRLPGGGIVERAVDAPPLGARNELRLTLRQQSFQTADRLAKAITAAEAVVAVAEDAATVRLVVPDALVKEGGVVALIARLGELDIEPDVQARVVIHERTGTIVAGERVRISRVAISHGALTITVSESPAVSQPNALAGGSTVVTPGTSVRVTEPATGLHVLDPGVTVADLAKALNALGVTPRDLVAIFQALDAAGALHAKLVIL